MNFTFIISFIAVIIISMCFTKKRFWEYRYIILAIGAGVALIATLTVNYSVRNTLPTKVVDITKVNFEKFYMPDSLYRVKNDSNTVAKLDIIKGYKYFDAKKDGFKQNKKDKHQVPVNFIIYEDSNKDITLGFMSKDNERNSITLKDVYIDMNTNDSTAYYIKKKKIYDVKANNWISDLSMPRISDIIVVVLPPKQYALIPDSIIRKSPY